MRFVRPFVPVLLGLLVGAGALWGQISKGLPAGSGQIEITFGREAIEVHTYQPEGYVDGPLVIVLHGAGRGAPLHRDVMMPMADERKVLLAAPRFDAERFPGERYQRGGVTRRGRIQPPEQWTYAAIPLIVERVRTLVGRPDLPYYVIGHSAGGQFAIRMAAMMPGDAVRIVAANPGSLLFPNRDHRWGFGFAGLPEAYGNDTAIRRFLAAPVTLLLGTDDNDPEHHQLDRSAPAMTQGPHRFARGHACYAAAKALAEERGWAFNWRLVEIPGVGHQTRPTLGSPQAAEALFGAP